MNGYIMYFSLTLGFSTLFSMGGVGAAMIGSYLGNRIMHFKLSPAQVKKLIGVVTYQLATKIKSNQRRKP